MEMRNSVCLPIFSDSGGGLDLGGVFASETSANTYDKLGNGIAHAVCPRMQPLPGAQACMKRMLHCVRAAKIAICTGQTESDAQLSIRNLFDEGSLFPDQLFMNLFVQAQKANNPHFFRAVATHLQVPVEHMLFIDDEIGAIVSALKAGYGYAVLVGWREDSLSPELLLPVYARRGYFKNVPLDILEERVFLVPSVEAIEFAVRY